MSKLTRDILERHQDTRRSRLPPGIAKPGSDGRIGKTALMLALEQVFGTNIDQLLMLHEDEHKVADILGVDNTTVSKWRLKRGLRTTRSKNGEP